MAGVEPYDCDVLAQLLQFLFVHFNRASGCACIVAALDEEHGSAHVGGIGDRRTAGIAFGLLLWRTTEKRSLDAPERLRRVFVLNSPVCDSNTCHAACPQIGTFAKPQQCKVAAIGPAGEEDCIRLCNTLIDQPLTGCNHIFYFPVTKIVPDATLELASKGDGAVIVDGQEGETRV